MLARVRAKRPEARIEGFLVQRQAARALELRLRLGDDAMFGPWIGFGQGGTAADLAEDEAHDLPPLNLALADQLIARSRTSRLMAGFRDHAPVNQAAVADVLVRLSQIAVDFPEIEALTLNPLFADSDGVLAVDAHLVLRPEGECGVLAIPPYPAELSRPWRTKSGEVLTIRPVRPEDAETHGEFFHTLAPEDVRWRFFSPLKELSPTLTARLTQIDYDREIAFVASRRRPDGRDETLGRLPPDPRPGGADQRRIRRHRLPQHEGAGAGPAHDGAAVRMGPRQRRAGDHGPCAGRQRADAGLREAAGLHREAVAGRGGRDGDAAFALGRRPLRRWRASARRRRSARSPRSSGRERLAEHEMPDHRHRDIARGGAGQRDAHRDPAQRDDVEEGRAAIGDRGR